MTREAIAGVLAAKEDLENLVEWMRRFGVTRVGVAGLELELGPVPAPASQPATVESKDAAREAERAQRIAAAREALETEWGHVGGVSQIHDDEIEKYLRGESAIFGRTS